MPNNKKKDPFGYKMDAIKDWANKKPCSIISLRRKLITTWRHSDPLRKELLT